MKNKIIIVSVLSILFTVFMMVGCSKSGGKESMEQVSPTITKASPSVTIEPTKALMPTDFPTPTKVAKPTVTIAPTKAPGDGDNNKSALNDLSKFKTIKDSFVDYKFNVVSQYGDDKSEPEIETSTASYDLNKDGKEDNINIYLANYTTEQDSYIEVNQIKCKLNIDNLYNNADQGVIHIVDLDKKDKFLELAIFDPGMSDDWCYHLLQYDGKQLYELGIIDMDALIDQQGKLVSSFNITRYFKPMFCSAWYEIKNKKLELHPNDTKQYLGKTYDFTGGDAMFKEGKPTTDDITYSEQLKKFPPGKIKLKDILYDNDTRTLNYFYVELPSGKKGLLYFWIGD